MYEMRSSVMPSDKPQSFSCSSLRMSAANRPFSLSDCVKSAFSEFGPGEAGNVDTEDDEEDGSRIMALNCMLPRSMRVSTRRVVECRGARREETSTVTFAHRLLFRGFCGSEEDVEASREDSGIQCRRVPGVGSGGGENGETWRKTGPRNSLNIELSTEGRSAGCYRVQRERKVSKTRHTERRENHEQPLSERGGDFAVVELADEHEILLCEVNTDFLPRLPHCCVVWSRELVLKDSTRRSGYGPV